MIETEEGAVAGRSGGAGAGTAVVAAAGGRRAGAAAGGGDGGGASCPGARGHRVLERAGVVGAVVLVRSASASRRRRRFPGEAHAVVGMKTTDHR